MSSLMCLHSYLSSCTFQRFAILFGGHVEFVIPYHVHRSSAQRVAVLVRSRWNCCVTVPWVAASVFHGVNCSRLIFWCLFVFGANHFPFNFKTASTSHCFALALRPEEGCQEKGISKETVSKRKRSKKLKQTTALGTRGPRSLPIGFPFSILAFHVFETSAARLARALLVDIMSMLMAFTNFG